MEPGLTAKVLLGNNTCILYSSFKCVHKF